MAPKFQNLHISFKLKTKQNMNLKDFTNKNKKV